MRVTLWVVEAAAFRHLVWLVWAAFCRGARLSVARACDLYSALECYLARCSKFASARGVSGLQYS